MPSYTRSDFTRAFLGLFPRGVIWSRAEGGALGRVASVWALMYERGAQDALGLLVDAFPATAGGLLPEWEKSLGLPDTCCTPAPEQTPDERRHAVVEKLTGASGGCSKPYFIGVAKAVGYDITIEEFAPARAGLLCAGDVAYGTSWAHAWRIHGPKVPVMPFLAGASQAGDPLRRWGLKMLECVIARRAPAHTTPVFAYEVDDG